MENTKQHIYKNKALVKNLIDKKIEPYQLFDELKYGQFSGFSIKVVAQIDAGYLVWSMKIVEKFYIFDHVAAYIHELAPNVVLPTNKIVSTSDFDAMNEEIEDEKQRWDYASQNQEAMARDGFRMCFELDSDWDGDESEWMEANGY